MLAAPIFAMMEKSRPASERLSEARKASGARSVAMPLTVPDGQESPKRFDT